jgi:P-aminobenzoate N-oxygenase AurF
LRRRVGEMPRRNRLLMANINGLGGLFFRYLFTNTVTYSRAGLDGREARRVARANPNYHEVQRVGFAPLAAFLEETGLMGPIARRVWKRTKYL